MHIFESLGCSCGAANEDHEPYFFTYTNHVNARNILNTIDNRIMLNVNNILYGDNKKSQRQNNQLIDLVAEYIKQTKRF